MKRTVSTLEWFGEMARRAPLRMRFNGDSREEWIAWRRQWRSKLQELMGRMPSPVEMEPEVIEERDTDHFRIIKILYGSDALSLVPAYLLIPHGIDEGEAAGVLCAHGHSGYNLGKDAVAGVSVGAEARRTVERFNYDYAKRLALRGYVTMAPDWRAFGERLDRSSFKSRDPCDVCQNMASWLGYNLLTLDVMDARAALDYLASRPEVGTERIGMIGLSYGGRLTTFTAALDERIKVAVVSGALNLFVERIQSKGSCGSQVVPGLLEWGDIPEVLGLIAPRPLIVERGLSDRLLPGKYFVDGFSRLRSIYDAAGASERLAKDEFEGGHMFHGKASLDWLDRWL